MRVLFRISEGLLQHVRRDLVRRHAFAFERVGFVTCRAGRLHGGGLVLLAGGYLPVADKDYIDDSNYGALIGPGAIRMALQHAFNNPVGLFHIHAHPGHGRPYFSSVDELEMRKYVPSFFNARGDMPHGALVLSVDSAAGLCWSRPNAPPQLVSSVAIVGAPMRRIEVSDE